MPSSTPPDRLYADHAATTPLSAEVREAMLPWLETEYGNASSQYWEGRRARAAVDQAREAVSAALGCLFGEVVFTGSGTEAANLALIGAALAGSASLRPRILVSAAEHHCVLGCGPILVELGYRIEIVPVDRVARVDPDALRGMLADDVLLVAAMHANNELGTVQDVARLAEQAHEFGALLFCDAVQSFAHFDLSSEALGADMIAVSAHKLYGPKGVGALMIQGGTPCEPLLRGGGQERDMRAGTENVAGIVGFGVAVAARSVGQTCDAVAAFYAELQSELGGWSRTAPAETETLPGFAHVLVHDTDAETLLIRLDRMGVSASAGAACSSGSLNPSHVLAACGYSEREAKTGIRLSFGRKQDDNIGKETAIRFTQAVKAVRGNA